MNRVVYDSGRLFLCKQLIDKLAYIKLTTNTLASYSTYICGKTTQVNDCSTNKKISPVACTFTSYKNLLLQDIQPIHELSAALTRSVHCCPGNRSLTTLSSTVTDTTKTEDVIVRDKDMSQYVVGHDKDKGCFYIRLQDNTSQQEELVAKLEYQWVRPGLVELYHTEVPPQFHGKGIAKVLAQAAFDAFCKQEVLIRPACTYLQKYLRDNQVPLYLAHLEKGFVL